MPDSAVRLDKWLWAARFFKTRTAATEAVQGGKVRVNGEHAKAARAVKPGDIVELHLAPYRHTLVVTGIADRRGSRTVADALYQETDESRTARERLGEALRDAPAPVFSEGKPDRHARREIRRARGK